MAISLRTLEEVEITECDSWGVPVWKVFNARWLLQIDTSITISELSVLSLNTPANEEIASLSSDLLTEDDFAKVDTAMQNTLASGISKEATNTDKAATMNVAATTE